MKDAQPGSEVVVVRSLTESDLGIFSAHRAAARSKQRAININAAVAKRLLSPDLFAVGGTDFDCYCVFGSIGVYEPRNFGKIHKNWRLGGRKIEGEEFATLDSQDFALIKSVMGNDGSSPLFVTFISKKSDRVVHAGIAAIVGRALIDSMAVYGQGDEGFDDLVRYCRSSKSKSAASRMQRIPPMPKDAPAGAAKKARTIKEKIKSPHILERMLQVAGDLSAPAQARFMDTVCQLADQLRKVLLTTGGIISIPKNHRELWKSVAGQQIGFVDGGLANLSMLGSAPIAARVGGYVVTPGDYGPEREHFIVLKQLIDELYAHSSGGVYSETFPDVGALRDAARISIEAAGAVRLLAEKPKLKYVMLHGALVNPVSRYSDVMENERVRHRFPDFSEAAIAQLLPAGERYTEVPVPDGRERNFIAIHLRQLELMQTSDAVVCGVVERESTTSSVCREVLNSLDDDLIENMLPMPPATWKQWFRRAIDPAQDDDYEGQRITDSLLFRCVLEPGEALRPVSLNRNEDRRAPRTWKDVLENYPRPLVSYMQPSEWNSPVRLEIFEKDRERFEDTASLIMHCALLLPQYAFPVGLDIVDKFARIPDWISRPVNTQTAVLALRRAMDSGDTRLFDSLRRMLCGSGREWLLRPGITS